MVWDVTTVTTLTDSYVTQEVAELATARKCEKHAEIPLVYTFLPIAVETLSSMNDLAYRFSDDLGRRISDVSSDREGSFIFQQLPVMI